ncbi:MAG: hypothetical protein E6R05_00720 [Candidatus Moraniibacteriota bacterium]|nr:MAG: hypothetical protein E6R05_00720 [Candidatus Moranbacteria bacterium]
MSTDFDALGVLGMLPVIWGVLEQSLVFTVLKWFLMIYTIVLLVDVVLLILMRGVTENLKVQLYGTTRPILSKNKAEERWRHIERRLESDNPSQYKVAVLEADQYADEILKESGYDGANMGERLAGINPGQLQSYEALKAAHEVRNRIVREQNFVVTRDQAEELMSHYKSLLVELELLA